MPLHTVTASSGSVCNDDTVVVVVVAVAAVASAVASVVAVL